MGVTEISVKNSSEVQSSAYLHLACFADPLMQQLPPRLPMR